MTSRKTAKFIADCASDKKAEDITILDMRPIVNYCDYFVLASGNTDRQVRAIADHIDDELSKLGAQITRKEGLKTGDWVIFDTGDVVTHIFEKQMREFYNLEYLWSEAKKVKWDAQQPKNRATESP